jgi:DNA-binding transcriptional LysR family regulator
MSVAHLTLKQLRAIQAVYAGGTISAAAVTLNVTQSAVSVLLRQAEAALGTPLFDRTTRSLVPTTAAEYAIGIVERILGDISALGTSVHEIRSLQRGQVRLATTPATGAALLPATVRRFRADYPGISLAIDDCAPNQFFSLIAQEKVEFGLGTPPENTAEFDWQVLENDRLCLVVPQGHAFSGRDTVEWRDLDGHDLILSRRDYGIRALVVGTMLRVGVQPRVAHEIGFFASAAWMTNSGLGLSILPGHLAAAMPGVALIPLVDPVVARPTAIVTRRGRLLSPSCRRFVEMLTEDLGGGPA